jgi:hypothetical protein
LEVELKNVAGDPTVTIKIIKWIQGKAGRNVWAKNYEKVVFEPFFQFFCHITCHNVWERPAKPFLGTFFRKKRPFFSCPFFQTKENQK